jgi:putative SOS response-associated peptidase YedK
VCFSAKIWADYRQYTKKFGARIDIHEFIRLLEQRIEGAKIAIPKNVTDAFKDAPQTVEERHCRDLVVQYESSEIPILEEQLFTQRRRLADAERQLLIKVTKKATEDLRIAGNKIGWLTAKLNELSAPPSPSSEARIFPGVFCPVMVMDKSGDYLIKPMRYQCRPAGKPPAYDFKYPGTYNARRDNLRGYWQAQYGSSHAVVVASAFYENVNRHRLEGRELVEGETPENVILQFAPGDGQLMQIACLWSHWSGPGQTDLLSFAAITDEPPVEVSAAGHDRCIVPLKSEHLATWLAATSPSLDDYEAVLDDRERPYYAHLKAA